MYANVPIISRQSVSITSPAKLISAKHKVHKAQSAEQARWECIQYVLTPW